MDKEKFLENVKNTILRYNNEDEYDLKIVAEYYAMLRNSKDDLLLELYNDCKEYNFTMDFKDEREEYYRYGTLTINLTDKNMDDMAEEYYMYESYGTLNFYYEIKFYWNNDSYLDEYKSRITINKVYTNDYIESTQKDRDDGEIMFNKWYGSLTELQNNKRQERLEYLKKKLKVCKKKKRIYY